MSVDPIKLREYIRKGGEARREMSSISGYLLDIHQKWYSDLLKAGREGGDKEIVYMAAQRLCALDDLIVELEKRMQTGARAQATATDIETRQAKS